MNHNIYLYILVMAGVTYLIRMLPLALMKKEITNPFFLSFLYYVPYACLAAMTFPAILPFCTDPPSAYTLYNSAYRISKYFRHFSATTCQLLYNRMSKNMLSVLPWFSVKTSRKSGECVLIKH